MKNYKDKECERQQALIETNGLFDGIPVVADLWAKSVHLF